MEKQTPRYTTIIHKVRIALNLTCNEYCVADLIHALSSNPDSKIKGWCWASRKFIGKFLGISERGAGKIINRVIEKGFVEKDYETKYLKSTARWYNEVVLERIKMKNVNTEQSSATPNKVPNDTEQSSVKTPNKVPSINNTYKNIYNNNFVAPSATNEKKEFSFKSKMQEMQSSSARRTAQIIALYWDYKGIEFENEKQYQAGYKRELKAANLLTGYSNDRIEGVMMWLNDPNNCDFNWKLETIHKLIDQPNLKSFKKQPQASGSLY